MWMWMLKFATQSVWQALFCKEAVDMPIFVCFGKHEHPVDDAGVEGHCAAVFVQGPCRAADLLAAAAPQVLEGAHLRPTQDSLAPDPSYLWFGKAGQHTFYYHCSTCGSAECAMAHVILWAVSVYMSVASTRICACRARRRRRTSRTWPGSCSAAAGRPHCAPCSARCRARCARRPPRTTSTTRRARPVGFVRTISRGSQWCLTHRTHSPQNVLLEYTTRRCSGLDTRLQKRRRANQSVIWELRKLTSCVLQQCVLWHDGHAQEGGAELCNNCAVRFGSQHADVHREHWRPDTGVLAYCRR